MHQLQIVDTSRTLTRSPLLIRIARTKESGAMTFTLTQAEETAPFFELRVNRIFRVSTQRDQRPLRSKTDAPAALDPPTTSSFCVLSQAVLNTLAVRS
jgi:hypothetical protein